MAATALAGLTLADYSDPELLAVLNDVADDDGWADTLDIAHQLGFTGSRERQGQRCVGTRFSWMRRWEWVERHPETGQWRVSAIGRALIGGAVNKTLQGYLDKLKPADRVKVVRALGERANGSSAPERQIYRREWRRNVELRRTI